MAIGVYRVLVANEESNVRNTIEEIIKGEGLNVIKAMDGIEALDAIERYKPHLAILDVALPKLYGFVVCEYIKKKEELRGTKVILLATLFDEKRYTRLPTFLYGADDYIEKHRLENDLLSKVRKLLGLSAQAPLQGEKTSGKGVGAEKKTVEAAPPLEKPLAEAKEDLHENVRRLARIVVSDIILYTEEKLTDAIRSGNFYAVLRNDIQEGIRYLRKRVPPSVRVEPFLKEAFEEYLSKKKKEMGLG